MSASRATMLPRFATDGQHRRTQCCRHNVSSFCRGLMREKRYYKLRQVLRSATLLQNVMAQKCDGTTCERKNEYRIHGRQKWLEQVPASETSTCRTECRPAIPLTGSRVGRSPDNQKEHSRSWVGKTSRIGTPLDGHVAQRNHIHTRYSRSCRELSLTNHEVDWGDA